MIRFFLVSFSRNAHMTSDMTSGGSIAGPIPLNAAFVRTVRVPGFYGEGPGGHGLSLRVMKRAQGGVRKQWVQRLHIQGKQVNVGLGAYPLVTLAQAREKALENRRWTARGQDPRRPTNIPTFAEAAESVIALHRSAWKDGKLESRIWHSSFRDYVLPTIGERPVNEITPADVMAVLTPLWQSKPETGRRVRQRMGVVLRWCIAQGHRTDNPAGEAIAHVLPKRRGPKRHYPALHYSDVAEAIQTVQDSGAWPMTKLCFEFLVLTAARSGEARLARWEEIDFENARWTIPAERMKAGRPHRVPLSDRAIEILREARQFSDANEFIFPSAYGRTLSNMTLSKLLKDLSIPAVPHGFRTSIRVWAQEQTTASRAVMEAMLAHRLGDAAEQAYARSELLEKRRVLMNQWAVYLADTSPNS